MVLYLTIYKRTIEPTEAIKGKKTQPVKNACFRRFVLALSHVLFVIPPKVDAQANLGKYPRIHLVKPMADVHMISSGTV